MSEFEKWLRAVCFQKPTKEAYDLAQMAYKAGMLAAAAMGEEELLLRQSSDGRVKSYGVAYPTTCKLVAAIKKEAGRIT